MGKALCPAPGEHDIRHRMLDRQAQSRIAWSSLWFPCAALTLRVSPMHVPSKLASQYQTPSISATPPDAAAPDKPCSALDPQLAILRSGSGWDSSMTALLNMATEQMHAEGSLQSHELEAVKDPRWQKECAVLPHSLKEIGNKVASKIESDPALQKQASLLKLFGDKYGQQTPIWREFLQKGHNQQRPILNTGKLHELESEIKVLQQNKAIQPAAMAIDQVIKQLNGIKDTAAAAKNTQALNTWMEVLSDAVVALKKVGELNDPRIKDKLENELEDALISEVEALTGEKPAAELSNVVRKALKAEDPALKENLENIKKRAFNECKAEVVADLKAALQAMEKARKKASALVHNCTANPHVKPYKGAELFQKIDNEFKQAAEKLDTTRKEIKRTLSPEKTEAWASKLLTTVRAIPADIKAEVKSIKAEVKSIPGKIAQRLPETVKEIEASAKQVESKIHAAAIKTQYALKGAMGPVSADMAEMNAVLRSTQAVLLAATHQMEAATDRMTAVALEAKGALKHSDKLQKPALSADTVQREVAERKAATGSALQQASSKEEKREIIVKAALRELVAMRLEPEKQEEGMAAVKAQLKAVIAKTLQTVERVKQESTVEKLGAEMNAVLEHVPGQQKAFARQQGQILEEKLKPVVEELQKAANTLEVAVYMAEKGNLDGLNEGLNVLAETQRTLGEIKSEIKEAGRDITGASLDNFSRLGRLAKSIGEWNHTEKEAYLTEHPETDREGIDKILRVLRGNIPADFATPEDPRGVVLSRLVELAEKDARSGSLLWPTTAAEILARTPELVEYLAHWGEKKLGYGTALGVVSAALGHGAETLDYLVSVSPKKNLLKPRLRYLKVALAPLTITLGVRKMMNSVKPGEGAPDKYIKQYVTRELGKTLFRLTTSLLPTAANNAMALGLTGFGLYRGGEYRQHFIQRAASRLPVDALYAGGFEAYRAVRPKMVSPIRESVPAGSPPTLEAAPADSDRLVRSKRSAPSHPSDTVEPGRGTANADEKPVSTASRNLGKRDGDDELVFHAPTFNQALSSWLKDQGSSNHDADIAAYTKIFSTVPLSPSSIDQDVAIRRRVLDDNIQSQASYIYTLVSKLEAKSWPVDFTALKSGAERDKQQAEVKIQQAKEKIADYKKSYPPKIGIPRTKDKEAIINAELVKYAKATNKLSILDSLIHADNPNLPTLLKRDFSQLENLYSVKNEIAVELNYQQKRLASLNPDGASAGNRRRINAGRSEAEKAIEHLKANRDKNHNAINAMRVASTMELATGPRQVNMVDQVAAVELTPIPFSEEKSGLATFSNSRNQKIDQLLLEKLASRGVKIDAAQLDKAHTVRLVQGTAAGGGGNMSFSHENRSFSLRQLLLGEADRSIFIHIGGSQTINNIVCDHAELNNLLNNKDTRLNIADAVMVDVKNTLLGLAKEPVLLESYSSTALGTIVNTLANSAQAIKGQEPFYEQIVDGFLDGVVQPEPVLFKNKVVPDLFSLGGGDYRLMISVKKGELLFFNALAEDAKLPAFIKDHLSQMEQGKFNNADVQPDLTLFIDSSHKIIPRRPSPNITRPNVTVLDPYYFVLRAKSEKILSDVGAVIYTSDEKSGKLNNDMGKALVQSGDLLLTLATAGASSGVKMLTGLVSGTGFGLADIYLDQQRADSADRYQDVQEAEQNMLLGKIFLGVNAAVPFLSSAKGSGSGLEVLTDMVNSGKKKAMTLPGTLKQQWDHLANTDGVKPTGKVSFIDHIKGMVNVKPTVANTSLASIESRLPKIATPPVWYDKSNILSKEVSAQGVVFKSPSDADRIIKLYVKPDSGQIAQTNVTAFNKLYGNDQAKLIPMTGLDGKSYVAVDMRKIKGSSLADILSSNNQADMTGAAKGIIKEDVVAQWAGRMQDARVNGKDLNIGNTMFSANDGKFNLIDFDAADVAFAVSDGHYKTMYQSLHTKIKQDFLLPARINLHDDAIQLALIDRAIKAMDERLDHLIKDGTNSRIGNFRSTMEQYGTDVHRINPNPLSDLEDLSSLKPAVKYGSIDDFKTPLRFSESQVYILGNDLFKDKVAESLKQIESTDVGKKLLAKLNSFSTPTHVQPPSANAVVRSESGKLYYANSAGSTNVSFDPENDVVGSVRLGDDSWRVRPPSVALFHELLHTTARKSEVWQSVDGARTLNIGASGPQAELRVVGLGYTLKEGKKSFEFPFNDSSFFKKNNIEHLTENQYRKELAEQVGVSSYKPRPEYGDIEGQHRLEDVAGMQQLSLVDLPIVGKYLLDNKIKKIVKESLPIAQSKLDNAMKVMNDTNLSEEVALVEKAYFGKNFKHQTQLHNDLGRIKQGVGKISTVNFRFDKEVAQTTVAALDPKLYQTLGRDPSAKVIHVGRNGFQAYYEQMGKSQSAVADVLIHELSHGELNSFDFVYIGTKNLPNQGDVDVFELINLGNNQLAHPPGANAPVSRLGGADLKHISNIGIAGPKSIKNADSLAQFVALLDKKISNPEGYAKDYQALQAAAAKSQDFSQRLEDSVVVSRSRRDKADEAPAMPRVLLMVKMNNENAEADFYLPITQAESVPAPSPEQAQPDVPAIRMADPAITTPASFNKTAFDQALAAWLKPVAADRAADAAHSPYLQAFSTFKTGQAVSLEEVKDLKLAWSGNSSDVVGQAKYRYAALAYLSGSSGTPSSVDFTVIKQGVAREQAQVKSAFKEKVGIKDTKLKEKLHMTLKAGNFRTRYNNGSREPSAAESELGRQIKTLEGELNGLRHQEFVARQKQEFIASIVGTPYDLN